MHGNKYTQKYIIKSKLKLNYHFLSDSMFDADTSKIILIKASLD